MLFLMLTISYLFINFHWKIFLLENHTSSQKACPNSNLYGIDSLLILIFKKATVLPNPNDPLSDQIPSTVIASANKEELQTITKIQLYGMLIV